MVSSGRISNMSYVRMYMYDVPCACMHDVQRAYSIEVYICYGVQARRLVRVRAMMSYARANVVFRAQATHGMP